MERSSGCCYRLTYTSVALFLCPSSRASGDKWDRVPQHILLMWVLSSSILKVSPKSEILAVTPRSSLSQLRSNTLAAYRAKRWPRMRREAARKLHPGKPA